jgi:hypothetical protein
MGMLPQVFEIIFEMQRKMNNEKITKNKYVTRDQGKNSRSKQGLAKVRAKNEARKSHFMLLGMSKNVRE